MSRMCGGLLAQPLAGEKQLATQYTLYTQSQNTLYKLESRTKLLSYLMAYQYRIRNVQ